MHTTMLERETGTQVLADELDRARGALASWWVGPWMSRGRCVGLWAGLVVGALGVVGVLAGAQSLRRGVGDEELLVGGFALVGVGLGLVLPGVLWLRRRVREGRVLAAEVRALEARADAAGVLRRGFGGPSVARRVAPELLGWVVCLAVAALPILLVLG